jgi:hypothetical protein
MIRKLAILLFSSYATVAPAQPVDLLRYTNVDQLNNDSSVHISNIIITEWNGMLHSASSLQVDDHDINLLSNGEDRFAGKVKSLANGMVLIENKYGQFNFFLDEIAEIFFARARLAKKVDAPAEDVILRLSPLTNCSSESAAMLDFQSSNTNIDDWDANF